MRRLSYVCPETARSERPEPCDCERIQSEILSADIADLLHIYTIDMSQHMIERCMLSVCELVLGQFVHAAMRTLQAQHQAAFHLRLRSLKLLPFNAFDADLSNLFAHKVHNSIDLFRSRRRIHRNHAAIRVTGQKGVDRIGEAPLLSDFLE